MTADNGTKTAASIHAVAAQITCALDRRPTAGFRGCESLAATSEQRAPVAPAGVPSARVARVGVEATRRPERRRRSIFLPARWPMALTGWWIAGVFRSEGDNHGSLDSVRRWCAGLRPAPETVGLRRARQAAGLDHLPVHPNLFPRSVPPVVLASPERAFVDAGQRPAHQRCTTFPPELP